MFGMYAELCRERKLNRERLMMDTPLSFNSCDLNLHSSPVRQVTSCCENSWMLQENSFENLAKTSLAQFAQQPQEQKSLNNITPFYGAQTQNLQVKLFFEDKLDLMKAPEHILNRIITSPPKLKENFQQDPPKLVWAKSDAKEKDRSVPSFTHTAVKANRVLMDQHSFL